jgi:hypothetical protein
MFFFLNLFFPMPRSRTIQQGYSEEAQRNLLHVRQAIEVLTNYMELSTTREATRC